MIWAELIVNHSISGTIVVEKKVKYIAVCFRCSLNSVVCRDPEELTSCEKEGPTDVCGDDGDFICWQVTAGTVPVASNRAIDGKRCKERGRH